jgi:hypothetical protein
MPHLTRWQCSRDAARTGKRSSFEEARPCDTRPQPNFEVLFTPLFVRLLCHWYCASLCRLPVSLRSPLDPLSSFLSLFVPDWCTRVFSQIMTSMSTPRAALSLTDAPGTRDLCCPRPLLTSCFALPLLRLSSVPGGSVASLGHQPEQLSWLA